MKALMGDRHDWSLQAYLSLANNDVEVAVKMYQEDLAVLVSIYPACLKPDIWPVGEAGRQRDQVPRQPVVHPGHDDEEVVLQQAELQAEVLLRVSRHG